MKLDTTSGFNALAVFIPAIAIIQDMQAGLAKTILLGLILVATSISCFVTRGYKPSEKIDESTDINKVLKEGRE